MSGEWRSNTTRHSRLLTSSLPDPDRVHRAGPEGDAGGEAAGEQAEGRRHGEDAGEDQRRDSDGAGGVGYLLKERVGKVEKFLDTLHRVIDGGTVLDPEVVSQLMVRRRAGDPMRTLTPREREVLALMAEGHANGAIAELLVITETAVSKHIGNIFAKLLIQQP